MTDPLGSCKVKTTRAGRYLEELDGEVKAFLAKDPYRIVHEHDPQTSKHVYWIEVAEEPPFEWGVIIGDIVHNLRSSLDHLAWQLALRDSGSPPDGTEFPVFHEREKFHATTKQGDPARGSGLFKIRGITGAEDRQRIIDMQPYNAGDRYRFHELWALHELNRIDKHRFLHVVGSLVTKSRQMAHVGHITTFASRGDGPFSARGRDPGLHRPHA